MGNSSTKESRPSASSQLRPNGVPPPSPSTAADSFQAPPHNTSERPPLPHATRSRGSRRELFLGAGESLDVASEARKETKAERDVRRAEKEKMARARERERSLKEEGVDGGYLVTLGTYTGPEDFSKPVVRQLMV